MTDDEFLQQIEACSLPKEAFTHRNHVRLAWLYLNDRANGDPDARIAETIARYATSIGKATKFDAELTMNWMRKVEAAMAATPADSFDEFMASASQSLSNSKL
jgi:hypothetical protein